MIKPKFKRSEKKMEQKMELYIDSGYEEAFKQILEFSPKAKYPPSLGLDHPSVKKVIKIALELTKEKKLITSEVLYNRAKQELQIPKGGLITIIQMLLNKKILIEGSVHMKMTVLFNKNRHTLYQLVKTHIGAHFSFLKAKLSEINQKEIGVGQLKWHLEKLIAFNLIRKVKVMNYIIFLPIEFSDEEAILHFVLRDDLNKEIVEFLIDHEPVKRTDLYKEFNGDRGRIYYRINKLIEMKIISALSNNENYISLNSEKQEVLIEVINAGSCIRKLQKMDIVISMQT